MAPRGRGQTENKGSATQEVISPPAFLGAILPVLKIVIQELMVGGSYLLNLTKQSCKKVDDKNC
jgi:hypothetical protein